MNGRFHSPACILSFFITALARGELTRAWAWTEEETTKKELQTEETSTRATSGAVTPEPQVINVTGADRPQPNGMRLRDI